MIVRSFGGTSSEGGIPRPPDEEAIGAARPAPESTTSSRDGAVPSQRGAQSSGLPQALDVVIGIFGRQAGTDQPSVEVGRVAAHQGALGNDGHLEQGRIGRALRLIEREQRSTVGIGVRHRQ